MFKTNRITLRKLREEDYTFYHNWRNDIEVMSSTSLELDQYNESDTQNFITFITSQDNAKGYIIEDIKDHTPIGIISLINIDYKNSNAELIIDLGNKDYWNKGIATEATTLLMNYVFNELNLHRLYLRVFSFNENAIKLYKKLGFKNEGIYREALFRNGSYHDIQLMGILNSEYNNSTF